MNGNCGFSESANAYVAGELSATEHAAYEVHLEGCTECVAAVEATRGVIWQLRTLPEQEVTRDLAAFAMEQTQNEAQSVPPWARVAAIAATLALIAGSAFVIPRHELSPLATPLAAVVDDHSGGVARALEWFCQTQESDGSWNAEKWGGDRRFETALTGLPALALVSADSLGPEGVSAVEKAALWLQRQQNGDGSFGPRFQGMPYNQSIATLALLHAYRRQPDAALKQSLDVALTNLLQRQTVDGGWGYLHGVLSDRSITEWHMEALELASALGWEGARPHLVRGRAWLDANPDPRTDAEEPVDSPSAMLARSGGVAANGTAKLDFYRAYFLTASLRRAPDVDSRKRLAAIRHSLLTQQVSGGFESGSWPADDRWGRAGGRLYSTALASLALREP